MNTFNDFCKWAGNQRRAAAMLGVSEASVSRWAAAGKVATVAAARNVEAATHGLFKWADMLTSPDEQPSVPRKRAQRNTIIEADHV